jgi:hypothetical protein
MKIVNILILLSLLIVGCIPTHDTSVKKERMPEIFPDYKEVTIPYNIAPLNFRVDEDNQGIIVKVSGKESSFEIRSADGSLNIPRKKWSGILNENRGGYVEIAVSSESGDELRVFDPFRIYVSGDPIDDYFVYRQIMPGFQNWNQMGIYQRSLTGFRTETVINSKILPGTCMNCHSFALNNPENMVIHLRESYGGTMLYRNGQVEKLNTRAGKMFGNAAFPFWHPSARYIAFSVNRVNQIFHAVGPHRANAVDMKSDVFVYDIENNEMLTSASLSSRDSFESFPCFSPDGENLVFCSADSIKLPEKFDSVKYSLLSVSFDPSTGAIGEVADTLVSALSTGKSVSIPRYSPDGRFIMFNLADYGCFPSYNPEADLYMLDTATGTIRSLDQLNSDDVESYHSWSSNGRWVIYISRRKDGLYSNPYIAHIDENGNTGKPFLLPQKDPSFYDSWLFSFNVPEFITGRITLNPYKIEKAAKRSPAVQVTSESGH